MFDKLSQGLTKAIQTLKGHSRITETNIANSVKEIRRVLIQADVHYKVAKHVTETIKEKALGSKVIHSVSPGQLFTKIVNEELTFLMGSEKKEINIIGNPAVIMLVGLQGSGKTTLAAKLAASLKKKPKKVLLVACDIYRPAAIEQLKVLGNSINVDVYAEPLNKNVLEIAQNSLKYAKDGAYHVVIIDTAGRLGIDEAMMEELMNLKENLNPSETLFVIDSMIGQDAVNVAKAFDEKINFDGIVLTKLDGDAKGGVALSICSIVNKPIKFISVGEKITDLDTFHPERMAGRILGMGDIISFVEKAEQAYDDQQSKLIDKKFRKNELDFNDLLMHLEKIEKMGSIKGLMNMLPSSIANNVQVDENALKISKFIINSMTPYERTNPSSLKNIKRCERIAKGSGKKLADVKKLIKQLKACSRLQSNWETMQN